MAKKKKNAPAELVEPEPIAPAGDCVKAQAEVAEEVIADLHGVLDRRSINAEMRTRIHDLIEKYQSVYL